MPCESKPELGENDPSRRFLNLKASFYQALADAFEHDQIEGLTDETTIGQLAGILTEFDSRGRIRIESKKDVRILEIDEIKSIPSTPTRMLLSSD